MSWLATPSAAGHAQGMWRSGAVLAVSCVACSRAPDPVPEPLTSTPLPARAAVDGPRFARLDPAATGLVFHNELRQENVVAYVYTGAGLAVGDYDADGLPDVYLVSQDGSNKLFRQTAPLRFVDVTEAAGGLGGGDAWGTAAAFADVDGDRDLDLYVCNLESPNLLWLNQGDGTFRESAGPFGLATTAASTGVAFADYDNDGDLDLYLLTNRVFGPLLPQEIVDGVTLPKDVQKTKAELFPPYPTFATKDGTKVVPEGYADFFATIGDRIFTAGQRDRLFRNDGYANWHDVTDAAGLSHHGNGLSVVWWDCDGDGRLDLYVANDLHSADKLYHNLGDGRFEDITGKALPHTAFFGMGCDFGDLDHDGRFDLCVADMSSTTHYMGKMLMGSMNVHRWFLMHAEPQQYMRNAVYVNTGTGRFLEAAHLMGLASTDWTWSVRLADLDEDTRLDAFFTNGIPVFTDDPDAGNRFKQLWDQGRKAQALDLYRSLRRVDERNIARRNLGDLKFEDTGALWGLDESSVGQGAVIADLDRDGDLDVLVNNQNQPASLFENRTSDSHRILVQLHGTASNTAGVGSRIAVTAGGVTQTALVMPTRGYASAGEAVEHFGLGAATKVDRLEVRWPNGRTQQFAGLDADRHYTVREPAASAVPAPPVAAEPATIFASRADLPVRHRERDFDDYVAQPLLPHRLSRLGPGIACADVDGDGRTDVWVGGAAGQAGTLLLAGEGGTFAARAGPWSADAECEDLGAVFVDFDSDGDQDLYVASGGVEAGERTELLRDRLYRNDGTGAFTAAPAGCVPDERHSGSCVVAADFDRDGDLDLFVGSRVVPGRFPHAPASALLRNDGGRFVDATAELLPELRSAGMVASAVWADLDDDGWSDLVVAAQWQPIRVFGNAAGKGFRDRTTGLGLSDVRGQWNGVAAGDLDGDGDLDLVATNLGLNTKYKASAASPQHLFARDFDGNGTLDVVEAKHQGPAMLPVRGLSCSSEAMPFLTAKFPTYDAFARANLTEIYGQEPLQQCLASTSNELRHVVLENQGGTFVLHALPRLAQVSAGFGIAIGDFDGDGFADVVLGHNSFSPEPETGRFDGGLGVLLRGRPGLQFDAVPAHASGIVMPEDSKGLCTLDLDGDASPDFLGAANDGPVRAFLARPPLPSLAVRLAGPDGNPTAVGARVQLMRPDTTRQVVEIVAGSGYLGQGEAAAFFTKVTPGSRIVVRWPDGHTTEHAAPAAGPVVLRR